MLIREVLSGTNANNYAYEHIEKIVSDKMVPIYTDNYPNFGWELEGRRLVLGSVNKMAMKFKRDRHLVNKVELTRLQRQFDAEVKSIETMEQSKAVTASMVAFTVGVVGCAFLAGSVFAFLGGLIPLCILLAIPGIVGWITPYWLYKTITRKKTAHVTPFIEKAYDNLYAVCERAHSLLH